MVAAAKLRRNQARIEALRPYARDMIEMMEDLATYSEEAHQYALLQEREVHTVAVVAMAPTAAWPARSTPTWCARRWPSSESCASSRSRHAGARRRPQRYRVAQAPWLPPREDLAGAQRPAAVHGRQEIAAELIEMFTSGQVDRVRLVYNHFTSPIEQTLQDDVILPVPKEAVTDGDDERPPVSYIYEPAPEDILAGLLPAYVEIAVYRALLESSASEQGARMSAMRNASESAEEMIDSLTLALNRARQAAITQEDPRGRRRRRGARLACDPPTRHSSERS